MFNDWLLQQLQERNWSQADLARATGITRGGISNYINGRTPDAEALRKIARALKLSPELVFEKAGLIPPSMENEFTLAAKARLDLITDPNLQRMALNQLDAIIEAQRPHSNSNQNHQTQTVKKGAQ